MLVPGLSVEGYRGETGAKFRFSPQFRPPKWWKPLPLKIGGRMGDVRVSLVTSIPHLPSKIAPKKII
jgi:hypothetical protein